MKTINRNYVVLATLLVLSFGTAAFAEKGAERLVNPGKTTAPALTQIAATDPHTCASCTDVLVSVVDKSTKGPNFAMNKLARHNCNACETKLVTAGTGKMKHDIALHSCNMEIKAACCAKN